MLPSSLSGQMSVSIIWIEFYHIIFFGLGNILDTSTFGLINIYLLYDSTEYTFILCKNHTSLLPVHTKHLFISFHHFSGILHFYIFK